MGGLRGQGTQQWPFSSREGPSVKCVFLQFEKVESGQIGCSAEFQLHELCEQGSWSGGGERAGRTAGEEVRLGVCSRGPELP